MVQMRMGDEDVAHRRATKGRVKCGVVRRVIRPGIDHGDFPGSDQVCIRSPEGHRRGIRGKNPPDTGFQFHHRPGFRSAVCHSPFRSQALALGFCHV